MTLSTLSDTGTDTETHTETGIGIGIDTDTDTAELYHRLTSYDGLRHWTEPCDDPRVRADFIPLRPGRLPAPFKEYPATLPVVALPRPAGPAVGPAVTRDPADHGGQRAGTPTLEAVSAILFNAAGVIRTRTDRRGRVIHYRAASSAGNRHPIEVYLCARGIAGLPDAVWHYDPRRHALTRIGPAPLGEACALVLGGVPWRTCWKYAERGYRHLWWDCGTLVAHALAAGREHGLDLTVRTAFVDADVARLIGAHAPHEVPLAVLPLTGGRPAITPASDAQPGDLGPGFERFPLVEAVHAAGELATEAAVERWLAGHAPLGTPELGPDTAAAANADVLISSLNQGTKAALDAVVRDRRSTRHFATDASLSEQTLRHLARLATARYGGDSGIAPDLRLILHAVDTVAPGAYRWSDGELRQAAPAGNASDRTAGRALCLDQDSARDCAVLALFVTDAQRPTAREYRAAQLAAGIGLGRLYLAATALGIGCTGLTFVDALLPEFGLTAAALGPAAPRTA
jgi:SagB-type dehydrogenase family enzyme